MSPCLLVDTACGEYYDEPSRPHTREAQSIQLQEAYAVKWEFMRTKPAEELAEIHFFTMKKWQPEGEVAFQITVKEYALPPAGQRVRFFAQADKLVNQRTAALLPSGWGDSVVEALEDCLRLIRQFPYEGDEQN